MPSIKKRIAELEVAKTKAGQSPMTDAERAVRATAIFNNLDSPARSKLVVFFERYSDDFRKLRHQRAPSPMVQP
jgi:hypothetical protein